jgi:hypothetical protein
MKRIATLFTVCAIMLFAGLAQAQSPAWDDYCGHQANVILKTSIPVSQDSSSTVFGQLGAFFQPNLGVQQFWTYGGYSYKWLYLNLGGVSGWVDKEAPFIGLRAVNMPLLGRLSMNHEFELVGHEGFSEFYAWNTIDYNFTIDGRACWAGINAETVKQSISRSQGGVHIGCASGNNSFEVYTYHGDHCGWNVRTVVSIAL